jgi:hypothetical protein
VDFYLSPDREITVSDYYMGPSGDLPPLAPGEDYPFTAIRELPTDVPPGDYFVGWMIDVHNVAEESNESNNAACKRGYMLTINDTD